MKNVIIICMFVFLSVSFLDAKNIYVDRNSPQSSDSNPGSEEKPIKSISRAAELAMPGDTVIVKDGVYREWVKPQRAGTKDKPVVYRAANRHGAIIKGSKIFAGDWERDANAVYAQIDESFFEGYNPFEIKRKSKHPDFLEWVTRYSLGQVFVDGKKYNEVLDSKTLHKVPQSWFWDAEDNKLYINPESFVNVDSAVFEISVRPRIFAPIKRGLGYITVEGFVVEHCSNQYPRHFWEEVDSAQAGAIGCGSGHHWVIRDNIVRYANTIGIDCGSESSRELQGESMPPINQVGYHHIDGNVIELNGCTGIAGWNHFGTKVTNNIIRKNNSLGIMAWETAGIKFHGFYEGLIKDNLIEANDAWGIWCDNVYKDSTIESNLIIGNLWGGIFFEMGSGPCYVKNNIIANSISGNEIFHRGGHGIYGHDAGGIKVYHNLIYCNSGFGVTVRIVADRPGGKYNPCQASDWDIRNNLFIGNKIGNIAFTVPFERSENNVSNNNIFLNGGINENTGFFSVNSAVTASLKKNPEYVADFLSSQVRNKRLTGDLVPHIDTWRQMPYLTFVQWQAILGHDKNSKLLTRQNFSTIKQMPYIFQAEKETKIYDYKFDCLDEVQKDYFGNETASDKVYAGPFQQEFDEFIVVHLWPKSNEQ